ncbi:MAG: hypothetical protein ACI9BW_001950, partial [Gammaproteobacteria bacterium]
EARAKLLVVLFNRCGDVGITAHDGRLSCWLWFIRLEPIVERFITGRTITESAPFQCRAPTTHSLGELADA